MIMNQLQLPRPGDAATLRQEHGKTATTPLGGGPGQQDPDYVPWLGLAPVGQRDSV